MTEGFERENQPKVPEQFVPDAATEAAWRARGHMLQFQESAPDSQQAVAAKNLANESFAEMVELTQDQLFGSIYKRTNGDVEATGEIVQESYIRAYKHLPKFRGDAQVSTWLHQISFNRLSSYYSAKARRQISAIPIGLGYGDDTELEISEDTLADGSYDGNPEAQIVASSLNEDLLEALKDLTPKHRVVWYLRNVLDWSHEQIAAHQGITETASKVRSHRAIKSLRSRFHSVPEASQE